MSRPEMHGADAASEWIAMVVEPDFCKVGGAITPFDTTSVLGNWDGANPETRVRARTHRLYRDCDQIQTVQGNAGQGVGSGVSLGGGYVLMVEPDPLVRVLVMGRPMVHHGSRCLVNTNAAGAGGVEGMLQVRQISSSTQDKDAVLQTGEAAQLALLGGDSLRQITEGALLRYAPRDAAGRYVTTSGELTWAEYRQRLSPSNFQPRRGASRWVRGLRTGGKVLGPAGAALDVGVAGYERYQADAARTDLTDGERVARAAIDGGANAAGGLAGAWAGAQTGAAIGAFFGPAGVLVGGVVGGIVGAYVGGKAADAVVNHALDSPPDNPFPIGDPMDSKLGINTGR